MAWACLAPRNLFLYFIRVLDVEAIHVVIGRWNCGFVFFLTHTCAFLAYLHFHCIKCKQARSQLFTAGGGGGVHLHVFHWSTTCGREVPERGSEAIKQGGGCWEGGVPPPHEGAFAIFTLKWSDLVHT